MAPPPSKTTGMSPHNFGLNAFCLSFIPPLFYFLSKTLEGIFFPSQPFANLAASKSNLLRTVSSNTCSLTELEATSIYNDHRRSVEAWQAGLAVFFGFLLRLVVDYSEKKWTRCSDEGRRAYYLQGTKDYSGYYDNAFGREWNDATPHMVPSHNDYRISQRREATRLLFRVMVSACHCPTVEYFLCAREAVSDRLYNQGAGGEETCFLWRGLFIIYLVFRYGTLPCFLAGLASHIYMCDTFKKTEEDAAVGFWDRWIERWIKAHQMENEEAEAKWVAEMIFWETEYGHLYIHSPEQNYTMRL